MWLEQPVLAAIGRTFDAMYGPLRRKIDNVNGVEAMVNIANERYRQLP